MQTHQNQDEDVTMSDILSLASWDRERSEEELRGFIEKRHEALNDIELSV